MPNEFDLPHIDIGRRAIARPFQAPREARGGGGAPRIREEHGARLQAQLSNALSIADEARPTHDNLEPTPGVYLEVELARKKKPDKLEKKSVGISPGAVKLESNETSTVALYVPDNARPVLERILEEYRTGPLTDVANEPRYKDVVEPIEEIRQARLETLWTDALSTLPDDPHEVIWWEIWCFPGLDEKLVDVAARLGARLADRDQWLSFPEAKVIPIYTDRLTIELLLFAAVGIAELRRASATPVYFTEANRQQQYEWAASLAEQIVWPGNDAPAVCLFDTGVNRAHVLIEPALSPDDMSAVNANWGQFDEPDGHGTSMAGLALHGDLTSHLRDTSERTLSHRLESVKVLPSQGFDPNDPRSYGPITQAAVSRAEINNPERHRVFCMAVTNDDVSGSRSTTWSAAIDQAAAGVMPGDDEGAPRRLFLVAAGNAPAHIERTRILSADNYPIEDPAQAWNAITVGGYTDRTHIAEEDLQGWEPVVGAGELSPHTRTSVTWPQGRSPFKPDIVMEAGNRAMSPDGRDVLTVDSLGVLTTGSNTDEQPFVPFAATSAATALAARLAARLGRDHPDYWPETIRALIVHSAEWTEAMKQQLDSVAGMRDRYPMLRRFGYGVPSYERASASAQNHLALIAQREIQPFTVDGRRKFKDCHFYRLPWPRSVLEEIGAQDVRLKITLSYFVEPNPGVSASIDPQRYQSYGLRFDLRRPLESETDFVRRANAMEREDPLGGTHIVQDDSRWKFGPKSLAAGSLHSDEWVGPAVQLAARDIVCIKPVVGWWRNRASVDTCQKTARYALVLTLSAPNVEVDLHTAVANLVETDIGVEIPF